MAAETTALEVMGFAKSGGYFEGDIPTDNDELLTQAKYFTDEAEKAWETGMRDPTVGEILIVTGKLSRKDFQEAMAQGEIISDPDLLEDQDPDYKGETAVNYASSGSGPPKSSGGYSESDLREPESAPEPNTAVEAESEAERFMGANKLPIPQTLPVDNPALPGDLTTLDDRVLRQYHSLYNGFLGRARWLLGIATGDLIRAEHLRDEAFRVALLKVNRIDPKTEKPKSVATLDAEAKESADYQMWAQAANDHEREVAMRKSVVEIYQGNVAVLSREWTMRTEEFERSK